MKINRDSWHFKLIQEYDRDLAWELKHGFRISFCKYFWCVMWCFPKLLALFLMLALLAAMAFTGFCLLIVYPLNFLLIGLFDIVLLEDTSGIGSFGMVLSLMLTVCLSFAMAFQGDLKVVPKYLKLPAKEPKPKVNIDKKPNIFLEYIKAKKAKMCPLVTLQENTDENN